MLGVGMSALRNDSIETIWKCMEKKADAYNIAGEAVRLHALICADIDTGRLTGLSRKAVQYKIGILHK